MKPFSEKNKLLHSVIYFLYLVFFTSFICSFRAITSISLGLLMVTGIVTKIIERRPLFQSIFKYRFVTGCMALWLLQVMAMIYTENKTEGWANIQIKSALVFIPLVLGATGMNAELRKKLMPPYCLILAGASLFCLLMSFLKFLQTHDTLLLFYHPLVSPLGQHAVYFSIYVFIALVFLYESILNSILIFNKWFHIGLVLFFTLFLILLSSKLVILFYGIYLIYFLKELTQIRKINPVIKMIFAAVFISGIALVSLTKNPISKRFRETLEGNSGLFRQKKFNPGIYFNGIQFRLLQWRFVPEILNEQKSWWTGVGPGDSKPLLNARYITTNMYVGEPARGDQGYLNYNTHNQFLETLLQTGITGLLLLLFTCYGMIKIAWQQKKRINSFIVILLLAWLFSESAISTQYGILIFTFFPLFFSLDDQ